ncbi:MAG: hypothetical protein LBR68_02030 [Lachnoclostridium sp.]|jgi:hypothetical protein|nr:hypothetical protein [Lachnoclostridium sp.]
MNKKQQDKTKKNLTESNITSPYFSLSPTDCADECGVYLNALDWALKDKTIKNIAISGPYGSGKSSIIQTFEKMHKKGTRWQIWKWFQKDTYTFLNISLATFKEEKNDTKNPEEKKEELLRLIELSIVQQLFFHEKESVLPDSRLKKIRKQSKLKNLGYTILSALFILSGCILFFPDFINKIDVIKSILDKPINTIYASAIFIIGCMIIIYKLYRLVFGISIKRLNINNTGIEIDSDVSKSILNNHIDEILYFFEATKYNVVVIEDLDRFEQSEIFTKLREINLLINNSKKIKRNIVFVYAIKDDMFLDKDRAKFFDFIIPIVPVINFSNSENILHRIVAGNKYNLKKTLIEDLAFFINDMRLLYNIMNEYYIYSQTTIKDSNLDKNQLLSLIVYKNIHLFLHIQLLHNYYTFDKYFLILYSLICFYLSKIEIHLFPLLLSLNAGTMSIPEIFEVQ